METHAQPTTESQAAPKSATKPLLIRIEEAARMLSLGRSTVYQMLNSGELPSVRLGTARRIPLDALERWVADHTQYGFTEWEG